MDVSNASGYDGCTVAADACFVARHASDRRTVVLAEALNPQVRQVIKTYALGFGFEVVEVPQHGGVTDPDELGAAAADAAAVFFQQPNFLGCLEDAPALAAAANDAGALSVAHVDLMSLGVLEAPGAYGCAIALGEGQCGRQLALVRRPALRLPRGAHGLRPADAGAHRRRDGRRGRAPRVRAHAADARATHPPREGDLEHHDEPDAARARRARDALVARAGGTAGGGGDVPRALALRPRERPARAGLRPRRRSRRSHSGRRFPPERSSGGRASTA